MPHPDAIKKVIFLILILGLVACAKRIVYVPPEWQAPQPQHHQEKQTGPQMQQTPQAHQTQPPSQSPIFEPSPSFKESDITSNSQADTSSPQQPDQPPAQPQHLASMHLVDMANASLAQGKMESAISLFEQAVQVDVYNGEAFFGLARAWANKGSMVKASEFARKAEILFQDKPDRLKEVYTFEADIFEQLGDSSKAESYRLKASRF